MKTVMLAVLLLLAVSQSKALECHCGGQKFCSRPVETCSSSNDVCSTLVITSGPVVTHTKGCLKSLACRILNRPPVMTASCCSSDLCNR
uniref:lymphocyte antigen 6D-like n=1 Tax=Maylandia zebra TaxID=106582 RepID=UPI00032A0A6F|nr:lymphocyte antigen 6D-like [Maylandia zebra]